ncbi:ABC transporter [Dolosicoccus paucivorans]|nr:ABC transporter [Dolosicoccus paucivorans]
MTATIEIKGLQKSFGKFQALKNVTFTANSGEVVGFIGPNGAGKSTTIRILLGMIQKDGGSAKIFGQDVWDEAFDIHKRLSYVPGDVALWGNLTGGEIIDLLMKLHGSQNNTKRDELIQRFELDPRKKLKAIRKGIAKKSL